MGRGVNGFRFDAVNYLYEREDLRNEEKSNLPEVLETDYDYLVHNYTNDQPESYKMTRIWRELIDEYSNGSK